MRVAGNVRNGAAIEAVRTAAKGNGLFVRHEYRLEHDWQHILVTSTYRNEGRSPVKVKPPPRVVR